MTEVYRYRVPLAEPVRHLGLCREGVLLRCRQADGRMSWGEVAPLKGFSRETLGDILNLLQSGDIDAWQRSSAASLACGSSIAARGWVAEGSPAAEHCLPVCALLTGTSAAVLERAAGAAALGYDAVKVKVGMRPLEEDVELVHKVRAAIGPAASLRVDANRAWLWDEARAFGKGIRGADVSLVEEPLAASERLSALARHLPVGLDETLHSIAPEALDTHRYATAIVIKPMLLGNLQTAVAWAARAEALGIEPIFSASFETGIGIMALMHLASRSARTSPVGMDTYRYLKEDVLVPRLSLQSPLVNVPSFAAHRIDWSKLIRIR